MLAACRSLPPHAGLSIRPEVPMNEQQRRKENHLRTDKEAA